MRFKRTLFVIILCNFYILILAQTIPIVALDGYFSKKDSSYIFERIADSQIEKVEFIKPDSSINIIGLIGIKGIISITTKNPRSSEFRYLRNGANNLFEDSKRKYIVNGKLMDHFDMNSIAPQNLQSVSIISPLEAIQSYGHDNKGGLIIIKLRNNFP